MSQEVAGWIWRDSARRWLEYVALYCGYEFDDSDWDAFESALPGTDDEQPGGWYEYPFAGDIAVTVSMARRVGGREVMVKVGGAYDDVVAARLETLTDVL